jgi:hypothetical protein
MANKAQLQTNNIVLNEYITKIQELKGIASALPDNGSGIILPTLTNAGVAADLALGKQLIDGNGNVITGTHECESDSTETTDIVYLFNNGDKCTSVTGGWRTENDESISVSVGSAITFTVGSGSGRSAAAYTNNRINTSEYTKMVVTGNMTAADASEEGRGLVFGLVSSRDATDTSAWVCGKTHDSRGTFELTLDISNANSSYYACVYAHASKVSIYTVLLQ